MRQEIGWPQFFNLNIVRNPKDWQLARLVHLHIRMSVANSDPEIPLRLKMTLCKAHDSVFKD